MKKPDVFLPVIFLFLVVFIFAFSIKQIEKTQTSGFVQIAGELDSGLTNVGFAPFAITHKRFHCSEFLKSINRVNHLHIAWLYNTFGTKYGCLKKLMADEKLETLQTNLINEPGHRNGKLEPHEFLYRISSPSEFDRLLKKKNRNLKNRFFNYVKPLQKLLAENLRLETQCLINPGLESNVSDDAGKVLVEWTREAFPNCRVIWNPLTASPGRREAAKADLIEGHGPNPRINSPCIYNMDGTDINFTERKSIVAIQHEKDERVPKNYINAGTALQQTIETYANKCEVAYLWVFEYNCHSKSNNFGFLPPLQRKCEPGVVFPLVAKEVRQAHRKGKIYPSQIKWNETDKLSLQGCSQIRSPHDGVGGFLLKQSEFSDRGGVILDKISDNDVRLFHEGTLLDVFNREGNFHDGRPLYRSLRSPLTYPFKVVAKFSNGICYRISNPRIRND